MSASHKAAIAGFVGVTIAAASAATLMPFYSDAGKQRRELVRNNELPSTGPKQSAGLVRSNMNRRAAEGSKK